MTKEEFQHKFQLGIIRAYKISSSSPLPMVQKAVFFSARRLCVDFRRVNVSTVRDWYPIQHIYEFALGLQGIKMFTRLECVRLNPRRRKRYTEDCYHQLEFTRWPFGLRNATLSFQRLIDEVLRDFSCTFAYIDCVLIANQNMNENMEYLQHDFELLQQ